MKKITQAFLALVLSALMAFSNILFVSAASVAQVKNLKAKTVTYNSVTLSWKKVSGATYYVEQSTGKKWKVIKKGLKTNKLTVKKLTSGTKYKFRVRAKKGSSYGKYSKTLTVTPKPAKVKAKVSSVTATTAKLKWSKVSGASGYYVQKKNGKKWKKVATVKAKTTSYTIKKLTLGKTYSYRVVAYRTVGKKKVQGTASATLKVKPALTQTKSLKATAVTPSTASLSWSKVSSAEGYEIQVKNGDEWEKLTTVKGTTKAVISIAPNKEYEIRVRAYKGNNYGKVSSSITLSYTLYAASELKASSVTKESATLTWTKAENTDGYEVQSEENGSWKTVATVTEEAYKASIVPGTAYKFRVVAFEKDADKVVYADASNTADVKFSINSATALKAASVTKDSAVLTWTRAEGADGYEVELLENGAWKTVKTTTENTYTHAIVPQTEYSFRVVAFVKAGGKTYSGSATDTVKVSFAVKAASNLKASVSSTSVTLTWTAASGASGYEVQKQNGSNWETLGTVTNTEYKTTITPQSENNYRVVAFVTAGGKSYKASASNTASAKFSVNAASNLKGSASGNTTALTWSAASGVTGYEVQSLNGSKWETVLTTNETKATVPTEPGKEYSFRVVAFVTVDGNNYYGSATSTVKTEYDIASAKSLKVSSTTKEGATLTWTAASGVTGYEVQRQNGSKWETAATVTGTTATVPMEAGTQYTFRVVSFVSFDGKNYYGSATSTVRAKYTVSAASSLKASGTTKNSTNLSWKVASGVDGYEVQRLNGNEWIKVADTTSTSATVACIPGEYNSYRVVSYVTVGDKVLYGSATSTVRTKYSIKNPSSLSLGTVTKDTASLSWKAADGIDGYEIQRQENGAWVKHATSGTNSATVAIEPGVSYTFRVVAYITVEGTNYYSSATGSVTAKYNIAAASGLKATAVSANSATLSWTAVADATSYEVQTYNGSGWAVLTKVSATTASVSIIPDTTYKYRVISVITVNGKDYKGASSNELSVKYSVPAPAGAKVTSANDTSVALSWGAVSGAASYTVYNGSDTVATVTGTTATVTGLAKATSYSFTVKATQNINGKDYYSAASNTVSARTTPDAATGLSVSGYTETSASLKWNAAAGADGYIVYRGSGKLGTVTGTTYTATGLTANTKYTFKVVPYHNVNGFELVGTASNEVAVTTYFDTIENLTVTDINTNYAIVKVDWNKIDGATYEAFTKNTVNTEWVQVNEANVSRDYYYLKADEYDIGLEISEGNYKVNATWTAVSGAAKYVLQSRTSGATGTWVNMAETTGTSASFLCAPSTNYELRVVVYNGSFKVRAEKDGLFTGYAEAGSVPGLVSPTVNFKTGDAPAFNASDKNIKTAYVLKAVQAINNTKAEKTIKNMTKTEVIETAVDSLDVSLSKNIFTGEKIWLPISEVPGVDIDDLAGVQDDLNVNQTYTGTVTGGTFIYTADGKDQRTSLTKMISPYTGDAYLYNAEDVNSIDSKITAISYSKSGSTETIELTLAQEVATKSNDVTPIHKGLYEDFSGTASAEGMDDGRVTVGPTKIKLVINENGTLNSMTVNTTFEMFSEMTEEGISFRMTIRGTKVQDTYTFTR